MCTPLRRSFGWIGLMGAMLAVVPVGRAAAQPLVVRQLAGHPDGGPGYIDGTGSSARLTYPYGIATDGAGNVYIADSEHHVIRRMTPAGTVTTLAGLAGVLGTDDGTGTAARFNRPTSLAVDSSGTVFVSDTNNHTIRVVSSAGVVSTLAGSPGQSGAADGSGTAARFTYPYGITIDASNNLLVADTNNHAIRRVTPGGLVTTFVGQLGVSGTSDGTGTAARFTWPEGVAFDASGTLLYIADSGNHAIRRVSLASTVVTTFAGLPGTSGTGDGTGTAARFSYPTMVAFDGTGDFYVVDSFNHTIRRVTVAGVVSTVAGQAGSAGFSDGIGSSARFNMPTGVAVAPSGAIYVADWLNHTLRSVTSGGAVTTAAGKAAEWGAVDATGSAARFSQPYGVAADSVGNIYVTDRGNCVIRRIAAGGVVSTLAGSAGSCSEADGTGSAARFNAPLGIAVDSSGSLYVSDTSGHTIRRVTSAGVVTTLAGLANTSGTADGAGTNARFKNPYHVALDTGTGTLYVTDAGNHTIRAVTTGGTVTTVAGLAGTSGSVDGTGTSARLSTPRGIAFGGDGALYICDAGGHTIRRLTTAGVIATVAGQAGASGMDDGTGTAARFSSPTAIAFDDFGVAFIADRANHVVRQMTVPGYVVSTVAGPGRGTRLMGHVDGAGARARFFSPMGIAADPVTRQLVVADTSNHGIRLLRRMVPRDFDADALADVAVYRPSTGTWFSLDSTTANATYRLRGWGVQAQGDTPAPGDYDGDGIVDPTVYRTTYGTWFILKSSSGYTQMDDFGWGSASDTLVPGDYDGDGKTDAAVYRASTGTWYVRPSGGGAPWSVVFGQGADQPVAGDFDGDGRRDPAVYRPASGTWFWLKSSTGFTQYAYRGWGVEAQGDTPAPGDYDGDGTTDLCVFRPGTGTWFILESGANFTTWNWFGWGASGDTLVPADFDGDGKTDGAVYRASAGTWYVRPSSGAAQWSVVFGTSGDVPLIAIR